MPAKDRDTYIDPDAEEDYFSAEEHDSVGSGDDFDQGPSSRGGKRAGGLGGGKKGAESRLKSKGKGGDGYAWEGSISRTWDQVREDDGGSLELSVQEAIARARRKKLQQSGQAVRRTIIRHLVLMIDLSRSMTDRDLRPSRFDLSLEYARAFISEWFDQNPLGQIGVVALRNGIGERMGEMSGNPQDVLRSIADRDKLLPAGEPSLQNAIEMARGTMSHLPSHASREIVVIFGSLTTCDPDNIFDTLEGCVKDKIRISIVALAAEMKVCRELCEKTGGTFAVAMNEGHFKDVLFELVPPPAQRVAAPAGGPGRPGGTSSAAELMLMGFPSRLPETSPPSLCACHSTIKSEGFICPRCKVKLCDVPTDCDVLQGYRPV
ncbi:hypothetical protein FRC05_001796 [Tulasnella sp. 425]|nr:hypothetical protein FRC05_001796 [Tulasnella sp. 425]